MDINDFVHGAKGIAKATLQIGLADDATVKARAAKCDKCPSKKQGALGAYCDECKCYLKPKQGQQDETCPKKEW